MLYFSKSGKKISQRYAGTIISEFSKLSSLIATWNAERPESVKTIFKLGKTLVNLFLKLISEKPFKKGLKLKDLNCGRTKYIYENTNSIPTLSAGNRRV